MLVNKKMKWKIKSILAELQVIWILRQKIGEVKK